MIDVKLNYKYYMVSFETIRLNVNKTASVGSQYLKLFNSMQKWLILKRIIWILLKYSKLLFFFAVK